MKLTLAATLTVAALIASSQAKSFVVFLPSTIPSDTAKAGIAREIEDLVLKEASTGDKIEVRSGMSMKSLLLRPIQIPTHKAYREEAQRKKHKHIMAWLEAFKKGMGTIPVDADAESNLNLPEIFNFLGRARLDYSADLRVRLYGSPIFHHPKEEAYSMSEGYVPSLAHLTDGTSVYGIKEPNLRKARFYWSFLGENMFINSNHREQVTQFWAHLIRQKQGGLMRAETVLDSVYKRMLAGGKSSIESGQPTLDGKVEMVQTARIIRVEQPQTQEDVPEFREGYSFMTTEQLETAPLESTKIGRCRFGISWDQDCDCDLYLKYGSSEELYYGYNRSEVGIHLKDYLTSPGPALEVIELKPTEIDLEQIALAINVYSSREPNTPITGVIRLETNGKVYSHPFRFEKASGSGGSGNRMDSPNWQVVDVMQLVNRE